MSCQLESLDMKWIEWSEKFSWLDAVSDLSLEEGLKEIKRFRLMPL